MKWGKKTLWLPQYKYSSSNQHGDTFRKTKDKPLAVATLETEMNDIKDVKTLILLSDRLNTPVRYDFDSEPQVAYIGIVSKEQLTK